jgi:hypothetical protein
MIFYYPALLACIIHKAEHVSRCSNIIDKKIGTWEIRDTNRFKKIVSCPVFPFRVPDFPRE